MIHDSNDTADQRLGALVGDILSDSRKLVMQHIELLRHEIREDFRKSKRAALVMVTAHVLGVVGCITVAAMLVGLFAWALPGVPWWCWCGIVGGMLMALAAVTYLSGKRMIASMNLLPNEIVKALKENFP